MAVFTPSVPGHNLPAGEDHVMRRLTDIERLLRELSGAALPISPGLVYGTATNFALSTTLTTVLTSTVTVPTGFTRAIVALVGRVYAINPNAGADWIYAQTHINAFSGSAVPLPVAASGGSNMNVAPFSAFLTGLTPDATFDLKITASSVNAAWAANATNFAELTGSIVWLR